jgi:hypothetical protein
MQINRKNFPEYAKKVLDVAKAEMDSSYYCVNEDGVMEIGIDLIADNALIADSTLGFYMSETILQYFSEIYMSEAILQYFSEIVRGIPWDDFCIRGKYDVDKALDNFVWEVVDEAANLVEDALNKEKNIRKSDFSFYFGHNPEGDYLLYANVDE